VARIVEKKDFGKAEEGSEGIKQEGGEVS